MEQKSPSNEDLIGALFKIEELSGDCWSQDIEADLVFHPETMTEREKILAKKLCQIYTIAHGWNPNHECFYVHESWRK